MERNCTCREKEYNVELPEFGENLNEFSIIDFYAPGPKLLDNEHMISTQSYDLEPFLSGEYSIPPMKIKFWTDEEGPEDPHILESEEIKITVNSILEDSNEELMIVDVTPPVIPPPPDRTWIIFLILGLLGGGGIIAGLIYWFKTQKKTRQQINTIPAHQLAYRELEWLVKQDLIENGKFKLFYFGISCVLRHYIENRFNLHAPEQTTEEFLNELNLNNILQPNQKKLLQNFLNHCDLVKFAELVPSNEEIQSTFNTCKEFIIETENTEAQIIEPEGSQIKLTQNEVE